MKLTAKEVFMLYNAVIWRSQPIDYRYEAWVYFNLRGNDIIPLIERGLLIDIRDTGVKPGEAVDLATKALADYALSNVTHDEYGKYTKYIENILLMSTESVNNARH